MSTPPEADTTEAPDSRAGVIHDIGYRRYGGARLGRGQARLALFDYSLRSLFGFGRRARAKVLPLGLAGVLLLPAVISVAVTAGLGAPPLAFGQYHYFLQPAVALFLATQAPVLVTGDQRHQVLGLYFSRPLERVDYVAAKVGALFTGMLIVLVAPLVLLYLGELLAGLDVIERTTRFFRALGGAVVLAALLSSLGLALTAFTRRRAFGIASIIAVFLISSGIVSVLRQLATQAGSETVREYAGLFAPFDLIDGFQGWALGVTGTQYPPPTEPAGPAYAAMTGAMIVVLVLVVWWRYRRVQA